jgi:hypothetical protein
MNGFPIKVSNKTGKAGIPHNIGQNKKATVFRIINLEMYKDNLSRELSKDSLRELRSHKDNLSRELSNHKDSLRELSNHNALSLEENMKRGRENIKGKGGAG